ncbi:MAG: hypothetical protein A2W93_08375 [Bacteroidetes bacterium GWF2_43_63]|nr:MAG: hypothetical protein A2W94_15965 [Bacteroidetes bacterium GWE2_42_42]OFY53978.1 MAG: hypothetical protein A2W93_08375 [Bacteroidetes bacterium GWF2_43_63]HBG70586.1 hypothetical protein [Bacteroidales bacterium]HCB61468.1 hypothetical protein [Bacteroidales bacterium]HCY22058.1 hypothetical protein [Bacteroidales bacterium]
MRSIFILLMFASFVTNAQLSDNFSDGNFTSNPVWSGDAANYIISTSTAIPTAMHPGLQSTNTVPDTTYLSTPFNVTLTDSMEWIFWAKMSFNPSSSNFGRVYLVSDSDVLTANLSGYYVAMSNGGVDRLHLVRQDGNTHAVLITGTVANLNKTTNEMRIKVKRDNAGNWTLMSDTLGGDNFAVEGTANDVTYSGSSYFGIYSQYTVSNVTKFYYDDFYAGPVQVDTVPPSVLKVEFVGPTNLDVYFDEFVSSASASMTSHYSIDIGIGSPLVATPDGTDATLVHLILGSPIIDGIMYNLTVSDVEDLSGNPMAAQIIPFAHYEPLAFDVVINEIMADPSPVVMLPEYEYVELYNTTALPINLKNYILRIGTTDKIIGDVSVDPHGYLILCDDAAQTLFEGYGNTHVFTSFSVSNTGVNVSLLSPTYSVLSFAEFTEDWYNNSFKADGGWSVEQIDPLNPCLGKYNWTASNDNKGGTPGALNSVNALNSDVVNPELLRASLENDSTVRIWFSEPMDSSTVLNPANYTISNGLSVFGVPVGLAPQYQSVVLYLDQPVQYGTIYTVSLTDTLTDCVGNPLPVSSSVRFAIADSLEVGDIVINEVLYDPVTGVDDYVEIMNRTNKIIDLRFVTLATLNDSLQLDDQAYVAPYGYILFPGEYVAFTEMVDEVINYYDPIAPNQVLNMLDMPAYSNESGIVVLATAAGVTLDILEYNVDMQDPILESVDGVSLERIDFDRPASDSTNWHSAASTVNYGTPGYKNSQYSKYEGGSNITVSPESFSPDNDGYNDVLNIAWQFEHTGIVCNMKIFDSNGRFIKNIMENAPIGPEGVISWDGKTENGETAPIGIYVIFADIFASDGYTDKIKTVFVLAGKF